MKTSKQLFRSGRYALLALTFLALACEDSPTGLGPPSDPDPGNDQTVGDLVTETRQVHGFTSIAADIAGMLVIKETGEESLTIEAEAAYLDMIQSQVVDGRLVLTTNGDLSLHLEGNITVYVTVADLDDIDLAGVVQAEASDLDRSDLTVRMAEMAAMTARGSVGTLDLFVEGQGSFQGEGLQVASAVVNLSGISTAALNVVNFLEVDASGSATLEYWGDPQVVARVSERATITHR
ncbi:GIN domain-containing protein [Gemmatimonadota bacterium]